MNKIMYNGKEAFNRTKLKKVFFGKDEDNVWMLRTVWLDRDSLNISIVKSFITDDTMGLIVRMYLDVGQDKILI